MYIIAIYRVFHPTREYTFFSAVYRTFSKTDHMLGNKASLSKCKISEIIPCILTDHNTMKLENNCRRNHRKYENAWKLSSTISNKQWDTEESREEIR